MNEPPSSDDPTHAADLRRLIEIEKEAAALRNKLGLEHRVSLPPPSEASELAAHALIGNHASELLSIHAADGTYLWASPSSERLFGWRPEELVGRSAYDLFHEEDLARVSENHASHIDADGAMHIEYRLRHADGSYRWALTHSANAKDAKGNPQIVCFTQDITERREKELALHSMLDAAKATETGSGGRKPFVRMCAWCKSVAEDDDSWRSIDIYVAELTGREITHGICPSCVPAHLRSR